MFRKIVGGGGGQAAIILFTCALVYWLLLGSRPFDFSEGHRVIPGWTMLESGDWWHVRMFETTYMRKPPGMPWAIAAFSRLFGESVYAARAVSATCATVMSLIAWGFARRWFGKGPWALAAGLSQALLPLMWSPGRSAEIEMLNNLGAQLAGLGMVDVCWRWFCAREPRAAGTLGVSQEPAEAAPSRGVRGVGVFCIAVGLVIAVFAKGPASVPVWLGVIAGACVLARSVRPVFLWRAWAGVILGACVIVPLGYVVLTANHDPLAVREDVAGQFLWSRQRVVGVLTLLPLAFAAALPASLVLPLLFGRRARQEAAIDAPMARAYIAALLCGTGWIGAVVVLMALGVSNPRYAMPAAVLLAPAVAYTVLACRRSGQAWGGSAGQREAIRQAGIGRAAIWAAILLVAAVVSTIILAGPRRGDADAGVKAAAVISAELPNGATVWADDVVEARPDVLLQARMDLGGGLRAVWAKALMLRGELPTPGSFMLLRTDAGSGEGARYGDAVARGRLVRVTSAQVRTYEFTLYRVTE